jgi:hypothetical protein
MPKKIDWNSDCSHTHHGEAEQADGGVPCQRRRQEIDGDKEHEEDHNPSDLSQPSSCKCGHECCLLRVASQLTATRQALKAASCRKIHPPMQTRELLGVRYPGHGEIVRYDIFDWFFWWKR